MQQYVWTERDAELWERYEQDRSIAHRNALATYYFPLVQQYSESWAKRHTWKLTADELTSYGSVYLLRSIETFDPHKANWYPYLMMRLKGAFLDAVRTTTGTKVKHKPKYLPQGEQLWHLEHAPAKQEKRFDEWEILANTLKPTDFRFAQIIASGETQDGAAVAIGQHGQGYGKARLREIKKKITKAMSLQAG